MEMVEKRFCKCCGDVLRGRSDKLFCDDRCRNQHHNKRRKVSVLSFYAREIQRSLIKNQRILQAVLGERKRCVVGRDQLLLRGFLFGISSHHRSTKGGVRYYCLDLGYRELGAGRVEVFRLDRGLGVFM